LVVVAEAFSSTETARLQREVSGTICTCATSAPWPHGRVTSTAARNRSASQAEARCSLIALRRERLEGRRRGAEVAHVQIVPADFTLKPGARWS